MQIYEDFGETLISLYGYHEISLYKSLKGWVNI